jgi:hypothetical protein
VREVLGIKDKMVDSWSGGRKATEPQKNCLRRMKVQVPDDISFAEAQSLIGALIKRRELQLATPPQVAKMVELGMEPGEARRTTMSNASAYISKKIAERKAGQG